MSETLLDTITSDKNLEALNQFNQRLIGARMSYRQIPAQTDHPERAEDEIANFWGHYRNKKMELGEICWGPSFASYYLAKEALQKAFGANGGPEMAWLMASTGQNGGLPKVIDLLFEKMLEEDVDEFIVFTHRWKCENVFRIFFKVLLYVFLQGIIVSGVFKQS